MEWNLTISPLYALAAYAEVLKALVYEAEHLVNAGLRLQELAAL